MRDYGIDLKTDLDTMTWRRFRVLLNNLNPDGAAAARIRAEIEKKEDDPETDEESASKFFTNILSRR